MRKGETFTAATLKEAQAAIGYNFRDLSLLEEALTHKSYTNAFGGKNNERMEFLGDAVLELIVSERLYAEHPQAEEGELTALRQQFVSKTALYELCEREDFMRFLRHLGGRQNLGNKTVESLPEAILGAIYLDGGLTAARAFAERFLYAANVVNYKSLLQEFVQKRTEDTPEYRSEEQGERFLCTVSALGRRARGEGHSKQAAEFAAAENLYHILTEKS